MPDIESFSAQMANRQSIERALRHQGERLWFIGTILTVVAVGVALGVSYSRIHRDLVRVEGRIDSVNATVTKDETAIKVIAVKEGGDTKGLVDDILASAEIQQELGNTEAATHILDALPETIASLGPAPLPTESAVRIFQDLEQLRGKQPPISQAAFKGIVELANYESAGASIPEKLQSLPPSIATVADLDMRNGRFYISDAFYSGSKAVDNTGGHGFDIDGAVLTDVVLRNVRIIYRGEPLTLVNVTFVNCRFIVPDNAATSDILLEAVIKGSNYARIS